jgi:hypothetical protein
MARVVVANNIFEGRGLDFYRASDVTVSGNTFDATMESGYGVIEAENVAERLSITGNTIRRRGHQGDLIRVIHHSGAFASNLVINANVFVNDTPGSGVVMESVQDVTISSNDFRWNVPAVQALGVYLRSTIRPADGVMISGNRFAGDLSAAVFFGATQPFNQVSIVGNMQRVPVSRCAARPRRPGATRSQSCMLEQLDGWDTVPRCHACTERALASGRCITPRSGWKC